MFNIRAMLRQVRDDEKPVRIPLMGPMILAYAAIGTKQFKKGARPLYHGIPADFWSCGINLA